MSELYLNQINVKDLGALGDGVTDDTQSIQKALVTAGAGQIIYFPAGTYRIDALEFYDSAVTLVGEVRLTLHDAERYPTEETP